MLEGIDESGKGCGILRAGEVPGRMIIMRRIKSVQIIACQIIPTNDDLGLYKKFLQVGSICPLLCAGRGRPYNQQDDHPGKTTYSLGYKGPCFHERVSIKIQLGSADF